MNFSTLNTIGITGGVVAAIIGMSLGAMTAKAHAADTLPLRGALTCADKVGGHRHIMAYDVAAGVADGMPASLDGDGNLVVVIERTTIGMITLGNEARFSADGSVSGRHFTNLEAPGAWLTMPVTCAARGE